MTKTPTIQSAAVNFYFPVHRRRRQNDTDGFDYPALHGVPPLTLPTLSCVEGDLSDAIAAGFRRDDFVTEYGKRNALFRRFYLVQVCRRCVFPRVTLIAPSYERRKYPTKAVITSDGNLGESLKRVEHVKWRIRGKKEWVIFARNKSIYYFKKRNNLGFSRIKIIGGVGVSIIKKLQICRRTIHLIVKHTRIMFYNVHRCFSKFLCFITITEVFNFKSFKSSFVTLYWYLF